MSINHDQAIFDAIAAATDHNDDGIFVDVQKFIDTFNSHRDRKLCTSLDSYEVTHLKAMLANEHQKTAPVEERNRIAQSAPETHGPLPSGEVDLTVMSDCSGAGAAQTPPDQFMDDYKRDTTNAMAARIRELEAALREIDNMAPATCEVTLAHQMADIASAALASPVRHQS